MTNQELYHEAELAVERLFEDMSVSKEDAIVNLETLKDEIDVMIESLMY